MMRFSSNRKLGKYFLGFNPSADGCPDFMFKRQGQPVADEISSLLSLALKLQKPG